MFTSGRHTGADVSMPNAGGLSVRRILRERGCDTQILMLTARHEVGDRVAGLDAVGGRTERTGRLVGGLGR